MEFRILGPLDVRNGDQAVELAGGKQRALLALLIVNANEIVSTDRMIEELWGDRSPPTAPKVVQDHVSQLRRGWARAARHRARATGCGSIGQPRRRSLRGAARDGRSALERGDAESAADVLREGLALWRDAACRRRHEPFAQDEIARLEEARVSALEERIDADLALGRHAELIGELESLVAAYPLRERLRGQLMLALYRSGRQSRGSRGFRAGPQCARRRARARAETRAA